VGGYVRIFRYGVTNRMRSGFGPYHSDKHYRVVSYFQCVTLSPSSNAALTTALLLLCVLLPHSPEAWCINTITTAFATGKCFRLYDVERIGMEGNTEVGREGEFSSTVIPTIDGGSCGDCSIDTLTRRPMSL
jgi:hypothetical protein